MTTPTPIPNTITVGQINESKLTQQAQQFLVSAKEITVSDAATLALASNYLRNNKAEQKRLEEERKGLVDPLNKVVKELNAKYKPFTDMLAQAESIVKRAIGDFQSAEDRRTARENAEREETARRAREQLEAKADKAEAKGFGEKAEALREQASSTVATTTTPAPKVSGVSTRVVWKAEVTDVVELCRQIADGTLPPTLIDFRPAELSKIASTWQNNRKFPGLNIFSDVQVTSRA